MRSGELHGDALHARLRRDGLPGGNIRSDGLPLLQPLPLGWPGRPRGLRIDNIVNIVNTVNINIDNTVNIVNTVDIAKTYIFAAPHRVVPPAREAWLYVLFAPQRVVLPAPEAWF